MTTLEAKARAADLLGLGPDCGAHGCLFAISQSGMRTNGGCRCLVEGRDGKRLHPRERAALKAAYAAAVQALCTDA